MPADPSDSAHPRALAAGLAVAALIAAVAVVSTLWLRGSAVAEEAQADPAPTHTTAAPSPASRAVTVLREWDRARAAAWADGDPAALSGLYAAGSAAGAEDVAMLRRWTDRGLRVRGMRMQVLAVEVRARSQQRLVLLVTDRLTGAVAVRPADGEEWELPGDRASTRVLEFRRTTGEWLLASVRSVPR